MVRYIRNAEKIDAVTKSVLIGFGVLNQPYRPAVRIEALTKECLQ